MTDLSKEDKTEMPPANQLFEVVWLNGANVPTRDVHFLATGDKATFAQGRLTFTNSHTGETTTYKAKRVLKTTYSKWEG